MQTDHTTLFKSRWDVYRRTLNNNVLGHREIIQKARSLIETIVSGKDINILDLGCGNSSPVIQLMSGLSIASYSGIDLAENVLQEAQSLTKQLAIPAQFFQRDLFEGIPASLNVNFIFSSFAVHHGQREDKQTLFQTLFQQVDKGCYFCLIDIVRYPSQSREAYVEMISRFMAGRIQASDQLEQTISHVSEYDFPETFEDIAAFASSAGWQILKEQQIQIDVQFPVAVFLFQK